MSVRCLVVFAGLLLLVSSDALGQPSEVPAYSNLLIPAPSTPTTSSPTPATLLPPASPPLPVVVVPSTYPSTSVVVPPEQYIAPAPQLIHKPPSCESPYKNNAWRMQLDLIPTVSNVADAAFGGWDDNGDVALRLGLGYEGGDGVGTRLQFWGIGQRTETPVDDVELDASTFDWDFYKRFYIDHAELALGGGLAGSHLKYKLAHFSNKADYSGGGISIFGEGFYPLWQFKKTDIGSIGRGRIALMSGEWNDDGLPFINDTDHDTMTIVEVAWGLELRRRFGLNEEKYWYIDLMPEFQRWDSASLPDAVDPSFQGTNISFGLAW